MNYLSGEKLAGRLGPLTPDAFTLDPAGKHKGTPRHVRFAEVRNIESKWTTGRKWLTAGLIYGAVTIFSAVTLGY